MKNISLVLFVLIGLSACGTRTASESAVESADNPSQPSREDLTYQNVNPAMIEALNADILARGVTGPEDIMAAYIPRDPGAEGNYRYTPTVTDADGGQKVVTLVEEGLMDDARAGRKVVMTLAPEGSGWKVVALKETYKCWPGRGHEDWGAAPCE